MFENFVYDLLATVNKPEWPAAELLLSLLGRLLVRFPSVIQSKLRSLHCFIISVLKSVPGIHRRCICF